MVLSQTIFGVKEVIVQLLYDTLNDGVPDTDPEFIPVFYGWGEADARGRFIVVQDARNFWSKERMAANNTLLRYDQQYNIDIDFCSGAGLRSQKDQERACYEMYEDALTPLVRKTSGDDSLRGRLAGVKESLPISDEFTVKADDKSNPVYSVLTFTLQLTLRRE